MSNVLYTYLGSVLCPRTRPAYSPASRVQSFYFYIPHERLRPGGHLLSIFLSTPSLDTYFGRVCCFAYHQVIILNFHKLFCETFSNRTARVFSRTVVTVRRRQLSLLLGYICSDNFHPSMLVLETSDTRLSKMKHQYSCWRTIPFSSCTLYGTSMFLSKGCMSDTYSFTTCVRLLLTLIARRFSWDQNRVE